MRRDIFVSVVVPLENDLDILPAVVRELDAVMRGHFGDYELIFIDDDSPDGTADLVRKLAQSKPYVRCHQRIARRGLSKALIEGILSSSAPVIAVMDADLQHDETILPMMLDQIRIDQTEIVVGSRYCAGGSIGAWSSQRAAMSQWATLLSRTIVTTRLTDPMSGFFMIRRETFHRIVRRLLAKATRYCWTCSLRRRSPCALSKCPTRFGTQRGEKQG